MELPSKEQTEHNLRGAFGRPTRETIALHDVSLSSWARTPVSGIHPSTSTDLNSPKSVSEVKLKRRIAQLEQEILEHKLAKLVKEHTTAGTRRVILVTGAAGFIGSRTVEKLLDRGERVCTIDNLNDYYDVRRKHANLNRLLAHPKANMLTIYHGPIEDVDFVREIFQRNGVTHVCHLAARAGVRASIADPLVYIQANLKGMTVLLEQAVSSHVYNFVYASSSSVYGESKNIFFKEDDVTMHPVSMYAATKRSNELFANVYHHLYGLNCTGLRFFTVYGPNGRPDMAPFKFIDWVYHGVPIKLFGDGSTERDYTYIDDVVEGIISAVNKASSNEVFNLGNGHPVMLKDFVREIEIALNRTAHIERLPMQPGDVPRTAANISKAKKLLGYNPSVSLRQGINRTVHWYLQWIKSDP